LPNLPQEEKMSEQRARQLLDRFGVKLPPVPVEELAQKLGARLSYEPLKGNVSGMLYRREGESPIIGVNSVHAYTRQRFTIAHEIGHLLLHPGRPVIVDKLVRVNLRDKTSGLATDAEEIAANAFAAELLMPRRFVQAELTRRMSRRVVDADEWIVEELAGVFQVSRQALEYRLNNLGLRVPS
jgi:Zn-dependent peptidase ImmA (M78 family)